MWRGMGKGMLLWGIEGKWKAVLLWLRIMTAFWVSAKSAHACTEMEKRRKGKALFTIPGRGGMTGPRYKKVLCGFAKSKWTRAVRIPSPVLRDSRN